MRTVSLISVVVAAAIFSSIIPAKTEAADPAVICESGKLKEAGKYANCRMKAESKAVKKNEDPDYTKCESKFSEKWMSAEAKAAGTCPSNGDEATVENAISTCLADVSCSTAGGTAQAGTCWFLGELGASCDDTCAAFGRTYNALTDTYAGFGGSLANCNALVAAMPLPPAGPCSTAYNAPAINILAGLGLGCYWSAAEFCGDIVPTYNWFAFRDNGGATTSAATAGDAARICACDK